jgi:hypothetical protein
VDEQCLPRRLRAHWYRRALRPRESLWALRHLFCEQNRVVARAYTSVPGGKGDDGGGRDDSACYVVAGDEDLTNGELFWEGEVLAPEQLPVGDGGCVHTDEVLGCKGGRGGDRVVGDQGYGCEHLVWLEDSMLLLLVLAM